jgi:hypothetical protein
MGKPLTSRLLDADGNRLFDSNGNALFVTA